MRPLSSPAVFALVALVCTLSAPAQGTTPAAERSHDSPEWSNIASHLPDRATASAATLETAADVLRARRYGEDALVYYKTAMERGGNQSELLKKMGLTCLELQQPVLAHVFLQRGTRLNKKDPVLWNNLGATEFALQNLHAAIRDYRRALRLNNSTAVFHSNLALAYFDSQNLTAARYELTTALQLDPDILHRKDQGGFSAQMISPMHYAEVCFEMARIYASQGNTEAMVEWLTKAGERGLNLRAAMDRDPDLRPMMSDPRVQVVLKNEQLFHAANRKQTGVPSLGEAR